MNIPTMGSEIIKAVNESSKGENGESCNTFKKGIYAGSLDLFKSVIATVKTSRILMEIMSVVVTFAFCVVVLTWTGSYVYGTIMKVKYRAEARRQFSTIQ